MLQKILDLLAILFPTLAMGVLLGRISRNGKINELQQDIREANLDLQKRIIADEIAKTYNGMSPSDVIDSVLSGKEPKP